MPQAELKPHRGGLHTCSLTSSSLASVYEDSTTTLENSPISTVL